MPHLPVKFLTNLLSYKFIYPVVAEGILLRFNGPVPVFKAEIVKLPVKKPVLRKICEVQPHVAHIMGSRLSGGRMIVPREYFPAGITVASCRSASLRMAWYWTAAVKG
jgi:hypothetical protein